MLVGKRNLICVILAIILAGVSTFAIRTKVSTGGVDVNFSIDTPVETEYQLFWKNDDTKFAEDKSIRKKIQDSSKQQHIDFVIPKSTITQVRLDFGDKITKKSYMIHSLVINGKNIDIYREENRQVHDVQLMNEADGLKVQVTGNDPFIVFCGNDVRALPKLNYDKLLLSAFFIVSLLLFYGLISWFSTRFIGMTFQYTCKAFFLLGMTILLLYPLLFVQPGGNIDESENRNANPKPQVKVKGEWNMALGRQFENWYNDIFGGRKQLIHIYNKTESYLHPGEIENKKAFLGKDYWLFYKGDRSIELFQNRHLFGEEDIQKMEVNHQKQTKWLAEHGADFYVMVAPNKADVYGEFYKKGVYKQAPKDRVQLLTEQLSFPVVYPLEALLKEKQHGLVYYKNDTHWDGLGAYQGYLALMKLIREEHPDLEILSPEMMEQKESPHAVGDLSNMLKINDKGWYTETYLQPVPQQGFYYDIVELKKGNGSNEKFIRTKRPGKPYKVLVFRDSFSTALIPYLSETFGEVIYVWDHNMNKYTSLILEEKPQIVIHEMVSRYADSLLIDTPDWRDE